jgi:ribonuclease J
VIDGLTKLGANVVHKGNAKVHVSGHAAAGELLYCYNILQPRNVMPVHGEYRHLIANAKLAQDTGIPAENTIIAENGTVVDLKDGVARVVGQLDLGFVYVDGSTVGEITDADLKDRRILGEEGFISVIVVVDAATGRIITGPEIHARGFAEDDKVFDDVKPKIAAALTEAAQSGVRDTHALSQVVAARSAAGSISGCVVAHDRPPRHRSLTGRGGALRSAPCPSAFARPATQADGAFLGDMVVEAANWRQGARARGTRC